MHYISFELNLETIEEVKQGKFLRDFVQLREEGVEAAVRRIVTEFLSTQRVISQDDFPAAVLSPLLECVDEAMDVVPTTDGSRPPDFGRRVELGLLDQGSKYNGIRVSVERFSAQATVADDGDHFDGDDDYPGEEFDWMNEDDEEEEEEEENGEIDGEAAQEIELFLTNVRVGESKGGFNCGVCLEEMVTGSQASAMGCRHLYHADCIRKWLSQKKTAAVCPLCRFPAAAKLS